MDVVKYFYEEPAALEVLADDLDPDARRYDDPSDALAAWDDAPLYYRGYLAGTDLAAGRVGLTAIAHPAAFTTPLLDGLPGSRWTQGTADGTVTALEADAAARALRDPADTTVLVCADAPTPTDAVAAVAGTDRRHGLPALRRLLAHASVVLFPEPAHHGHDWSLFAAVPLKDTLAAAFHRHPHPDVRRFVIPFPQARSEAAFYFELVDLARFQDYEVG